MKRRTMMMRLSACALGVYALSAAVDMGCSSSGGSTDDGGTSTSSSGATSTSSSSGATSSSTSTSSSGATSPSSSGGGMPPPACNASSNCIVGDCPSCNSPQFCCLHKYAGGVIQGTCATEAMCGSGGGVFIQCQQQSDCSALECCSVPPGAAGVTGSTCVTTCATGSQPVCSTGNAVGGGGGSAGMPADCPTGASKNNCVTPTGTPFNVFGVCVPGDGGMGP